MATSGRGNEWRKIIKFSITSSMPPKTQFNFFYVTVYMCTQTNQVVL